MYQVQDLVMYKREEPILTVFSLHYMPEEKALNMNLLYFKQSHFFCTEHVRLVRFNLLLTFTLEFSLHFTAVCATNWITCVLLARIYYSASVCA